MRYVDLIKEQISGKTVCMYPMGIATKSTVQKIKEYGIEIDFFSDNNPELWGKEYKGKQCIPKSQLLEMNQENLVVIIESLYYKEIKLDLLKSGVKNVLRIYPEKFVTDKFMEEQGDTLEERVNAVLNICADEKSKYVFRYLTDSWKMENVPDNYFENIYEKTQYFDPSIIKLREDEVFVDAGAYTGDTAEKYIKFCNGNYEKMHLFELDLKIYEKLKKNVRDLESVNSQKIICYPYGVSDDNKEVHLFGGDSSSTICDCGEGDITGTVKKLDDILKGEKVTFIKMDIEGAEVGALKGGSHIIKKQTPKLAICIYHSPEDMLEIPMQIKELVPEYRIYIRHYTDMMLETVCYAVFEENKL